MVPIFASAPLVSGGLALSTTQLALPLALGGIAIILWSLFVYPRLRRVLGTKNTCRLGLLGSTVCVLLVAVPSAVAPGKQAASMVSALGRACSWIQANQLACVGGLRGLCRCLDHGHKVCHWQVAGCVLFSPLCKGTGSLASCTVFPPTFLRHAVRRAHSIHVSQGFWRSLPGHGFFISLGIVAEVAVPDWHAGPPLRGHLPGGHLRQQHLHLLHDHGQLGRPEACHGSSQWFRSGLGILRQGCGACLGGPGMGCQHHHSRARPPVPALCLCGCGLLLHAAGLHCLAQGLWRLSMYAQRMYVASLSPDKGQMHQDWMNWPENKFLEILLAAAVSSC